MGSWSEDLRCIPMPSMDNESPLPLFDILDTAKLSSTAGAERTQGLREQDPHPFMWSKNKKAEEDSDQELNYLRQLCI